MFKKEYEIIREFVKKPWRKFTFREIKILSGKKSESYIYSSLKKSVRSGMLIEAKVGNVILYNLNLSLVKTLVYTGFIAEYIGWNKKNFPYADLERFLSKISLDFFIFVITGSYANGTYNKKSDIDVVIICDDSVDAKKIYSELRYASDMNIPKIHLYIFKKSEFLAMLLNKESNYGKEIARNNIILFGGREYYKIITEAINNGFTG